MNPGVRQFVRVVVVLAMLASFAGPWLVRIVDVPGTPRLRVVPYRVLLESGFWTIFVVVGVLVPGLVVLSACSLAPRFRRVRAIQRLWAVPVAGLLAWPALRWNFDVGVAWGVLLFWLATVTSIAIEIRWRTPPTLDHEEVFR